MVGLFVRLKLRLLRNTLRMSGSHVAGFVVAAAVAFFGALFASMGLLVASPESVRRTTVLIVSGLGAVWLIGPLILAASDEALDPSRLLPYPLTRRQLMTGLLSASAVGIGPVATLVVLASAVAAAGKVSAAPLMLLSAGLVYLLCIVMARSVTTALSGVLRSRRGRDAALVVVALVGLAPLGFNLWMQRAVGDMTNETDPARAFDRLATVAQWSPTGMAAAAPFDAAAGNWGTAVLRLSAATVVIALLLALWTWALGRVSVSHDASTASVRHGHEWSSHSRVTIVAARERRYQWRDPRRRLGWLQAVILAAMLLGPFGVESRGAYVGLIAGVGLLTSMQAAQSMGQDGSALWLHIVTTARLSDVRADLAGKALAYATVALPLLTTIAVVAGLATGHASDIPRAVAACLGSYIIGLGFALAVAVLVPVPVPDASRNLFANVDPGRGCLSGLAGIAMMLVGAVLAAPLVIPIAVIDGAAWLGVAALLLVVAGGACLASCEVAARFAFRRLPELLAAVTSKA